MLFPRKGNPVFIRGACKMPIFPNREFIRHSLFLTISLGIILCLSGCKEIPDDSFLILRSISDVHENLEKKDPLHGIVIQFSADSKFRINGSSVAFNTQFVNKDDVKNAKCVLCQTIRYHGDISGTQAYIYFSDKIPPVLKIQDGFPKYRFDGLSEHRQYLDETLIVEHLTDDETVIIKYNQERFSVKKGGIYLYKTKEYNVEISPEMMEKEFGNWRGAYSNVKKAKFTVESKIENLGLFKKGQAEFYD